MSNNNKNIYLALIFLMIASVFSQTDNKKTVCLTSANQQSPIDIDLNKARFREETNFRILSSNYTELDTKWEVFENDKAIGFSGNLGYTLFLKDWVIYNFKLEQILFRYKSGHTIGGKEFPLEMELVHTIDDTYRSPGRHIDADVERLVISFFFVNDREVEMTKLFDYLNLDSLESNIGERDVTFKRPIKINRIAQHSPGYFYKGSVKQATCEIPAWRVIIPKYHIIAERELEMIKKVLTNLKFISDTVANSSNARARQTVLASTDIFTNDENTSRLLITSHVNQYDFSKYIRLDLVILAFFLCLIL